MNQLAVSVANFHHVSGDEKELLELFRMCASSDKSLAMEILKRMARAEVAMKAAKRVA